MGGRRRRGDGTSGGEISAERKGLYSTGIALSVVGLLLFLGGFAYGIVGRPDEKRLDPASADFGVRAHESFESSKNHGKTVMLLAFGGFLLLLVGQVLRRVGARGLAGAGLVLDPSRARREMEPWTRMAGGMAEDALSEVGTVQKLASRSEASPMVQVRCRACKALNAEAAKFCDQCGAALA